MVKTAYALAKLYLHEGKLKEAKGMYEQARGGNERTLGDSHGKTKIGLPFQSVASDFICCYKYLMGRRMV
jgi:hypothetical protein